MEPLYNNVKYANDVVIMKNIIFYELCSVCINSYLFISYTVISLLNLLHSDLRSKETLTGFLSGRFPISSCNVMQNIRGKSSIGMERNRSRKKCCQYYNDICLTRMKLTPSTYLSLSFLRILPYTLFLRLIVDILLCFLERLLTT